MPGRAWCCLCDDLPTAGALARLVAFKIKKPEPLSSGYLFTGRGPHIVPKSRIGHVA